MTANFKSFIFIHISLVITTKQDIFQKFQDNNFKEFIMDTYLIKAQSIQRCKSFYAI